MRWYSSSNCGSSMRVQVHERAERDEPPQDLAVGLRDLARLALLLGVELGEAVRVALARVGEAALRGVELGLRGVELRGRLADRALERRRRRSISWRSGSSAAASRRCCSALRRRSERWSPICAFDDWRSASSAP